MAERRKNVSKHCKIGTGSALGKFGGVKLAVLHIVSGVVEVGLDLCRAYLLDDPSGHAPSHRVIRDDYALRHQRTRADNAVFADDAVVQKGGVHSDEAAIPYRAPVHQRAVAYGNNPAERHCPAHITVEHCVILHVGVFSNGQSSVVSAEHCPVPHRRTCFGNHISLHGGVGRYKSSSLVEGNFSTKGQTHC